MYIDRLQIENVRNFEYIVLTPSNNINILTGENAAGKTAILESIYFLARARSFRTGRFREVIQHQKEELQISARINTITTGLVNTGIRKGLKQTSIRYKNETVRTVSEQAKNLPVILITPDSHQLVSGTPRQRRHWLDWAMFHVEPMYLTYWRTYHKSLRHRNALLKITKPGPEGQITTWERSMADAAMEIQTARKSFISELQLVFQQLTNSDFPEEINLILHSGWREPCNFIDFLSGNRDSDRQYGYSRYGAHRAEVEFRVGNNLLESVFSRGQIKLFISLLLVAQGRVFTERTGDKPIYLIDDYTAELDAKSRSRLLLLLAEQGAQVFLTATDTGLPDYFPEGLRLFHVERNGVVKMVE